MLDNLTHSPHYIQRTFSTTGERISSQEQAQAHRTHAARSRCHHATSYLQNMRQTLSSLPEECGNLVGLERGSYPTAKKKPTGLPNKQHSPGRGQSPALGLPLTSLSHFWGSLYKAPAGDSPPVLLKGNWVLAIQLPDAKFQLPPTASSSPGFYPMRALEPTEMETQPSRYNLPQTQAGKGADLLSL